jgi:Family of unknown function (DUF6152)
MKHGLPILLGTAMFLSLGSSQVLAHHAFYSTYDRDKTIKIEGTLKEFLWRNPHSYVRVEAPDEKGEMQMWVVEWAAPAQLTENGMTSSTLRPGDKIIISGHPGRAAGENHRMQMQKVERPADGWKWEGVVR